MSIHNFEDFENSVNENITAPVSYAQRKEATEYLLTLDYWKTDEGILFGLEPEDIDKALDALNIVLGYIRKTGIR